LPEAVFTSHLLSAGSPLKFPRAQFRRHLENFTLTFHLKSIMMPA
jgi:hypothetical protein